MDRQTGNPQAKVDESRLGWLAGFIDGEGTITLHRRSPSSANSHGQILPRVDVCNTNVPTLGSLTTLLSQMGVGHFVSWNERGPSFIKAKRPLWTVRITGAKRVRTILRQLLPYLVTKRPQAEVVWDYIQDRFATTTYPKEPYTEAQVAYVDRVRELNRRSHH